MVKVVANMIWCLLPVIFLSEPIMSFNTNFISPKPILNPFALTQTRFLHFCRSTQDQHKMVFPKKRQFCIALGRDSSLESVADIKTKIESAVQYTDCGIFGFQFWIVLTHSELTSRPRYQCGRFNPLEGRWASCGTGNEKCRRGAKPVSPPWRNLASGEQRILSQRVSGEWRKPRNTRWTAAFLRFLLVFSCIWPPSASTLCFSIPPPQPALAAPSGSSTYPPLCPCPLEHPT